MAQNQKGQTQQPGGGKNQQSTGGHQEGQQLNYSTSNGTEQDGLARNAMKPSEDNGSTAQERGSKMVNSANDGQDQDELENDDPAELDIDGNVSEIDDDEDDAELEGEEGTDDDPDETEIEEVPEVDEDDNDEEINNGTNHTGGR